MIDAFEFEDQGHTFSCATETPERIITFSAELLAIRARPRRERVTWHKLQVES